MAIFSEGDNTLGTTAVAGGAASNKLTQTQAVGGTVSETYDAAGHITADGTGGATAEKGELTRITDESGQTAYTHDAMGRLTGKAVTVNGKSLAIAYTWGTSGAALDKLTAITYPGGNRVNYGYDSQGFLASVSVNPVNANGVGVSGTAQALLGSITYNAQNQPTGWLWSDGKARAIGYDSLGQVVSYTLGDPAGTGTAAGVLRALARDDAGRITGYTHTNNGTAQTGLDQSFGYDNLNRLLTAGVSGVGTSYSYDATGNRTSKTVGGTTYTNTIASTSNKLTQVQDVGGTATVTHDAAGHITADGTNTYTYSDRGRMKSATTAAGTVTFVYNGLGQRAGKTGTPVATGAAYFMYDEAGLLLGEYDTNGSPVYETIYLGTVPVGVLKQTGSAANSNIALTLYNVSADQIDTPRVITKQDHTIVWRWDTAEAFGGTAPDQNPSSLGTFTFNQRFPGQVFDAETGLFQNWNREYNARTGRYVQSDPIGLAGGINTFAYVMGNPLNFTDHSGLNPAAGAMAGAGAGSAFGPIGTVVGGLVGAGIGGWLGWNVFGPMWSEAPPRGLPPDGTKPPIPEADQCKPGPASRPSESDKGGQSLWDPNGGEWRWFPGDKWHNPHWDYNPHGGKSSPWVNVPHGGLPPVKK